MEMIYTNGSTSADTLGTLVEMASTEAVKKAYSQGKYGMRVYVRDIRTNQELSQVKSDPLGSPSGTA
jgi:hypothetical protein